MKFTIKQAQVDKFYWILSMKNGDVVATSLNFTRKANLLRSMDRVTEAFLKSVPVTVVDETTPLKRGRKAKEA